MAAERRESRLTDALITQLAKAITPNDMKTIAMGYMDINNADIQTLEAQNSRDMSEFKRAILRIWAFQNAGGDQIKVGKQVSRKYMEN